MIILLIMALLAVSTAFAAECTEPFDGMMINESVVFCNDAFDLPSGLDVVADNIAVNCNSAVLRGDYMQDHGILVENRKNVTISNCNIVTFRAGVYLKNTTNSLVSRNSFLKNDIGVLLLDAYENIINDNADKSIKTAVGAITSKFNVVILTNKELDRAFCEVNACNEFLNISPCVDNDFYCSYRCNYAVDNDCPAGEKAVVPEDKRTFEDIEREVLEQIKDKSEERADHVSVSEHGKSKDSIPFWMQALIYLLVYAIGLILIQYYCYKKGR